MNTKRFEMRAMGLVLGVLLASVTLAGSLQGGPGGQGGGRQGGAGMGQRGGMRGGPQSIAMIAARPDVAQEINLTQEQGEQLHTLLESSRPQRGQGGPGQNGQNGERPDPETMRKEMQARMDAQDQKAAAILSAAQYKRVEELSIQMRGLSAALDPKVQAKLGLSSEQKSALDAIAKSQGGRGMGGPGGGRGQGGPGQGGPDGPPPQDGGQGGPPPPPPGDEGQGGGEGRGGPGMGGQRGPRGNPMDGKIAEILTDAQEAKLKTLGGKLFQFQRGPGGEGGPGGPGGPPPGEDGPGAENALMAAVLDGA